MTILSRFSAVVGALPRVFLGNPIARLERGDGSANGHCDTLVIRIRRDYGQHIARVIVLTSSIVTTPPGDRVQLRGDRADESPKC